jgi:hypothetical protein
MPVDSSVVAKTIAVTRVIVHRFLRVVDKFNFLSVSAYVTQGGKYLLLLHNGKNEDMVRSFFTEVHELYVKYMMNPFALPDTPIVSPQFSAQVRNLARRLIT